LTIYGSSSTGPSSWQPDDQQPSDGAAATGLGRPIQPADQPGWNSPVTPPDQPGWNGPNPSWPAADPYRPARPSLAKFAAQHAAPVPRQPTLRERIAEHRATLLITALVVLIAIGGGIAMISVLGSPSAGTGGGGTGNVAATPTAGAPSSTGTAPGGTGADEAVTMSATGDIIMGSAPSGLPPNSGKDLFTPVREALRADLQMGNLEQPLTNDTGVGKCSPETLGKTCFAFRSPPAYAALLRDAGFRLMNLANNHAYDFGPEGNRQTKAALEGVGLQHTGAPGQITVVEVKGVRVAVLGFSPYSWSQSLVDIEAATALVKKASQQADLVVVQAHMGGEGADKTHVRKGTETFLGENRGDPIKFSHAVIDAGADLVIGHGPHVMRAMEFYKGRLIAYSMGNFFGYRALSYGGVLGVSGILKATLRKDGTWVSGQLVATRVVAPGAPAMDHGNQAWSLIRSLCKADLPGTGAQIGADGVISPA
jgi:Bacterial capsule synthesis protein PGA_cap